MRSMTKFCQATDKICQGVGLELTETGCHLTAKKGTEIAVPRKEKRT